MRCRKMLVLLADDMLGLWRLGVPRRNSHFYEEGDQHWRLCSPSMALVLVWLLGVQWRSSYSLSGLSSALWVPIFICGFQVLTPEQLPRCSAYPGPLSVLVLDNATIHHSQEVRDLVAQFGTCFRCSFNSLNLILPSSHELRCQAWVLAALLSWSQSYRGGFLEDQTLSASPPGLLSCFDWWWNAIRYFWDNRDNHPWRCSGVFRTVRVLLTIAFHYYW